MVDNLVELGNELTDETKTLPYLPITLPGMSINNSPGIRFQDFPDEKYVYPEFLNAIDEGPTLITGEGAIPIESTLRDVPEKAGWFEQVGHALWENNKLALAGELAYQQIAYSNSANDPVPEGFTAMLPENVEGFNSKYWDYITDAKSPNDLKSRQDRAREQQANDERFADGSMTASLLGGALDLAFDPTNWLIPMAAGVKYAGIAQNVFLNMGKVAGGLALESVSRNMLKQADRIGGNLQEMATDSLGDFVFSTALVGAGAAVGGGLRASGLWNMRRSLNLAADGIKLNPVAEINKEGRLVLTGEIRPTGMGGVALSAEQTSAANLFINESMHMGGLFSQPIIGKPLEKFLSWGPLATPAMKALTSPYSSVKSFFNRIASTGIMTKGEADGIARADSAYDISTYYRDEAKALSQFIRGKFFEANGLTGGANTANALKNFKQTVSNNKSITEAGFGREVRRVAYEEGYKSEYSQAHEVANSVLSFFDKIGKDYHSAVGKDGEFLDPRTAWKYLPQNYNIEQMISRPTEFIEVTANHYLAQDFTITQLNQPIENAKTHVDNLKVRLNELKNIPSNAAAIKRLKADVKAGKMQVFRHQNELINHIEKNKGLHILLEDRIMFNESERAELNNILDPIRQATVAKNIVEARLRPLNDQKLKEPKDQLLLNKIKKAKEDLEAAELEIEARKDELQARARAGEISKKYWKYEGEEAVFHNPNAQPKFRPVFKSSKHAFESAKQVFDSITNQTPEDLVQNVLGHMEPGIIDKPSYLKQRTNLVDSQIYNEIGFLDPDIGKTLSNYASTMGKVIGFKKAMPEFADRPGFEGVLRQFKQEHEERVGALKSREGTKEGTKERHKLQKEYQKNEKFMSDTYQVYMGTYASRNPELHRYTSMLKNMVVSAKIGAVPLYQLAELGSILMKAGLMPFLSVGLRPLVKSLNGWKSQADKESFVANAAHAHLATNHMMNGYAKMFVERDMMSAPPAGTGVDKLGVWSNNLAHVSSNLFGINFISNMNERWMASAFQSEVMQAMFDHQAGKLTAKLKSKMARYGIQVEDWSSRFIKGFEEHGGWSDKGGHQSQYFQWGDVAASNRMSMSIRRAVQDTVVNGNIFTSPYWANNPFASMIFMFHGWAYGALNHYAIPLMQRPDAENILGLVSTVGLALFSEPLLRILNGKEAYSDDAKWFDEAYKAVDYSGILGPYATYLQDTNNALGNPFAGIQTERYKNRHGLGVFAGPVAGYVGDILNIAGHGLKGDVTQGDAARFERLLPVVGSHLATRNLLNKFNESLGLPEKRNKNDSWFHS